MPAVRATNSKSGEGETKMKNNGIKMFLALGAACMFASVLDAQSNELSAKVPFSFQVRGKDFAPGRYIVREYGNLGIPFVQNSTTGESVFLSGAIHSLTSTGPARLVFHCYAGNACFLAEVRLAGTSGTTVAMTKAEKEIASSDRPHELATISVDLRHAD
jgi:hypothetical protein